MTTFGFDHNSGFVVSAFLITIGVIGGYALYLRSRLTGLRQRLERGGLAEPPASAAAAAERSRESIGSSSPSPL
ncbi:MAG: CcmD family protein [Chloroflexi bacterium]|nr:CcmD family protein [Chloroflexota bacterium]